MIPNGGLWNRLSPDTLVAIGRGQTTPRACQGVSSMDDRPGVGLEIQVGQTHKQTSTAARRYTRSQAVLESSMAYRGVVVSSALDLD